MKYVCTHCRVPFNTEPYVKNGQGIWCQRNCYEQYLADSGYEGARPNAKPFYEGNHIKRR